MNDTVEPWLRGTHTELEPARRAVLHALELAQEDVTRWCSSLEPAELEHSAFGLPSVGFQLRHIARSLDRLMTYAEGSALSDGQLAALRTEHEASDDPVRECVAGIELAVTRLLSFSPVQFVDLRVVGRAELPTTVGALLIHIAEHTQRHVGQAITTAKVVMALRESMSS